MHIKTHPSLVNINPSFPHLTLPLSVQTSMDGTMFCRLHHANKNNVFFDRPIGRTGCSQISLPGDRLLVR